MRGCSMAWMRGGNGRCTLPSEGPGQATTGSPLGLMAHTPSGLTSVSMVCSYWTCDALKARSESVVCLMLRERKRERRQVACEPRGSASTTHRRKVGGNAVEHQLAIEEHALPVQNAEARRFSWGGRGAVHSLSTKHADPSVSPGRWRSRACRCGSRWH